MNFLLFYECGNELVLIFIDILKKMELTSIDDL